MIPHSFGALAQLVERNNGIVEVNGSTPLRSKLPLQRTSPLTEEDDDDKKRKAFQMMGTYATMPFILAVPPIMGWLIGSWLDKYFETTPVLMYAFLILGFAAGIREFYRIVKKYGNGDS